MLFSLMIQLSGSIPVLRNYGRIRVLFQSNKPDQSLMKVNLRKTSNHGFTMCISNDPIAQEECQHNPHIQRTDKNNKLCFNFRDMGYDVWHCNGIMKPKEEND